jgi:hypothetical protein
MKKGEDMKRTLSMVLGLVAATWVTGCDGDENTGGGGGGGLGATGGTSSTGNGGGTNRGGTTGTTTATGTINCAYAMNGTQAFCINTTGTVNDCTSSSTAGYTGSVVTSCTTTALLTCDLTQGSRVGTAYIYDQTLVATLKAASPNDPCALFVQGAGG